MSALGDKVRGVTNEMSGKAKQAIGHNSDDPHMEAEGAAQESKGHVQQAVGNAKQGVKDAIDKL